ncbi:disease resistance protein L6-like [Syzygium oleosum]|uniref:disease resistance protein L6-like n=1 Tax=Syzygium oleosum TaxID=219896 RepID=UPI0024BBB517|nr:disease resistance protein L6-like [Syzygium oleosum]
MADNDGARQFTVFCILCCVYLWRSESGFAGSRHSRPTGAFAREINGKQRWNGGRLMKEEVARLVWINDGPRKDTENHSDVIKLVVEVVVAKLKTKHRSVTEHLVGIDDRVVAVTELLDVDSGGVQLIGIHGMGGIGTRSIDEIDYGMKRTGEALSNKRVLIVLDVANSEQVEKLVGGSTLYSGSRILITTRNKDALRINRPNYQVLQYEMEVMSSDRALELFSKHAFNKDSPSDYYNDLSREIVSAAGKLPFALEVIGLFLFDKRQQIWKETLEKLSKAPHEDVFGKLKISYDSLSYEQQQIFLDIACFFIGKHTMYAIYMWKDCDFFPDIGVDVLISMSLVKIVENTFWMHDQLRDLGSGIFLGISNLHYLCFY